MGEHDDASVPTLGSNMTTGHATTVGVILLDTPSYAKDEYCLTPADDGLGGRPVGFFGHPATWRCPTIYRVARGCSGDETALASRTAYTAMREAAHALDGRVDVITTNCAYAWYVRDAFTGLTTPCLPSGIALLQLARSMSDNVALIVSESKTFTSLHRDPLSGIRIVELESEPEWHRFHCGLEGDTNPLSQRRMAFELEHRLRRDISDNGVPSAVVLECTGLPQFRDLVRSTCRAPVLDVVSVIHTMLGLETPEMPQRRWTVP